MMGALMVIVLRGLTTALLGLRATTATMTASMGMLRMMVAKFTGRRPPAFS